MKDNRLIYEFMGTHPNEPTEQECANMTTDELLLYQMDYHNSWDSLMPVVFKIETWGDEYRNGYIRTGNGVVELCICNQMRPIYFYESESEKLDAVYGAVVEFIKWKNSKV